MLGLGAAAAIILGGTWVWQQQRPSSEAVPPGTLGAPIPALPNVRPVDAPLPSQSASDPAAGATETELSARPDAAASAAQTHPAAAATPLPTVPVSTTAPGASSPAAHVAPKAAQPSVLLPAAPAPAQPPAHVPQGKVDAKPAPSPAAAAADAKPNSLIALSEDLRKAPATAAAASANTATKSPAATAVPTAAPSAAPSPVAQPSAATSTVRTLSYGSSGILTLTNTGVVVFDRAKGTQREIHVGQTLPDGSVVQAVNPAKQRIETDHGPIVLQ